MLLCGISVILLAMTLRVNANYSLNPLNQDTSGLCAFSGPNNYSLSWAVDTTGTVHFSYVQRNFPTGNYWTAVGFNGVNDGSQDIILLIIRDGSLSLATALVNGSSKVNSCEANVTTLESGSYYDGTVRALFSRKLKTSQSSLIGCRTWNFYTTPIFISIKDVYYVPKPTASRKVCDIWNICPYAGEFFANGGGRSSLLSDSSANDGKFILHDSKSDFGNPPDSTSSSSVGGSDSVFANSNQQNTVVLSNSEQNKINFAQIQAKYHASPEAIASMAFGDSIYGYDFTNSPAYPYRKVNTSSTSVLVDKGTQKVSRPAALSDTRKIMGPLRDTSSSSVVYTAGSNIMPSGISYYPYAQYGIYGGQYIYGVNDQKEGWAPYNPGRYFQPDSSSYYEALLNNKR